MVESNYDILGIIEGSTEKEIRNAFRRFALRIILIGEEKMINSLKSNKHTKISKSVRNILKQI